MTKPGTMRWKIVPSKKPRRTSEAKDDVTHGESLTSRLKLKRPRFVITPTECGRLGPSSGNVTSRPDVGQRLDAVLDFPPPPQAARPSTSMISDSCARRATAAGLAGELCLRPSDEGACDLDLVGRAGKRRGVVER